MKNYHYILLITLIFCLTTCNSNVKKEQDEKEIPVKKIKPILKNETETVKTKDNFQKEFKNIWQSLPLQNIPVIDTTNFDNIKKGKELNTEEIVLLELNKIYPNIGKEGYDFRIQPSYKIKLSTNFYTIILTVFKGDHELESVLINYNLQAKLITHKTIAYDEIAEGWSRKHSKIEHNSITIIDEFYGDQKQIDTIKFQINRNGDINKIKTRFSSKLRPNKPIFLNQIYTDTIKFLNYNDDFDYFMLKGKKNGNDVTLVYNWVWNNNDKYNFKSGDIIEVKWKMDSIFYAGDGETLDFKERAINAEKL